jgi:hypothetical protein
MAERVAALDGALSAGPTGPGVWTVPARLPLDRQQKGVGDPGSTGRRPGDGAHRVPADPDAEDGIEVVAEAGDGVTAVELARGCARTWC